MPAPQTDLIPRLWSAARAMFARMRAAVGDASAIAARSALSRDERRSIRAWLRPLEIMARKIALTHALALLKRGDTHARAAGANLTAAAGMRVCHPAALPAVTLIALPPPPVRIVTQEAAPARAPRARAPSLRLWPRAPASAGPRVRDLGPHLLVRDAWRETARLSLSRRMCALRAIRRPEPQRLARRIDALVRLLDKPLHAARRLARQLHARPILALKLALKPAPRTRLYADLEYALANACARDSYYDWSMRHARDTS